MYIQSNYLGKPFSLHLIASQLLAKVAGLTDQAQRVLQGERARVLMLQMGAKVPGLLYPVHQVYRQFQG